MEKNLARFSGFRFFAAVLIPVLVLSGCVTSSPNRSQNSGENSPPSVSKSTAEEVAIGEKIHEEILSTFRPYTEPAAVGYVNRIGKSLSAHVERKNLPYQFIILYHDKIYATSSPGGFVYLTTGMIYFLDNEAELAAVLAHELGELQYQDPKLSRSKKMLESILNGGSMVAPALGQIGALAMLGLAMVKVAADMHESSGEDRVRAADKKALGYMVQAGYDPQGMIDLQYKFVNARSEVRPYFVDYYQSRPISEERMSALSKAFTALPIQNKSFSTNRDEFLQTTKGIREIYRQ